jgi:hypothetical protein
VKRLLALALFAACGPAGTSVPLAVNASPLAGTVGGRPWRAVGGVASKNAFSPDSGTRSVEIGNKVIACNDCGAHAQLLTLVPWTVGTYDLSLQRNLTFAVDLEDGGIDNLVATQGRVEVATAPGPDAGGASLRIRAAFDADNTVEGEVTITVCD